MIEAYISYLHTVGPLVRGGATDTQWGRRTQWGCRYAVGPQVRCEAALRYLVGLPMNIVYIYIYTYAHQ